MCNHSLQKNKKTIILHTQRFNLKENSIISVKLNQKFKLNTKVMVHKEKYDVIEIPVYDSVYVFKLINEYIISSMKYKLPCIKYM